MIPEMIWDDFFGAGGLGMYPTAIDGFLLVELGLGARRGWSWWERPLAFGVSGVVMLVAMAAVALLARGSGAPPRGLGDPHVTSSGHLR